MPTRRKFSDYEMGERIRQGKDVKEIASEFGVSPQAVYKRAKQFKLNLSKDIAMNQAAKINQQQIDWSAQLLKINQMANDFLERLIEVVKAADEGEMNEKLKKIEPLLGEKASILEAATRVSGEIRQQLKLLLDGWKQVTNGSRQYAPFTWEWG